MMFNDTVFDVKNCFEKKQTCFVYYALEVAKTLQQWVNNSRGLIIYSFFVKGARLTFTVFVL